MLNINNRCIKFRFENGQYVDVSLCLYYLDSGMIKLLNINNRCINFAFEHGQYVGFVFMFVLFGLGNDQHVEYL